MSIKSGVHHGTHRVSVGRLTTSLCISNSDLVGICWKIFEILVLSQLTPGISYLRSPLPQELNSDLRDQFQSKERVLLWLKRALRRSERALCGPGRLFIDLRGAFVGMKGPSFRLRNSCVGLKGPCVGLRGSFYGLRPKWVPFRPKRAICQCERACAALRVPLVGLVCADPELAWVIDFYIPGLRTGSSCIA